MFKRILLGFLVFVLAIGVAGFSAPSETAAKPISVYLDGQKLNFDVNPTIDNGRVLVPLRTIFEELGAKVNWDSATKKITAEKNGTTINVDVEVKIVNNRALVPLRFVSEKLGAMVGWDAPSRAVIINTAPGKQVKVLRVVDGDTIEVDWDGKTEKVRMIGVDTPESVHPDASRNTAEGKTAAAYTKAQLEGKTVVVCTDVQERDQYGRILAYVFVDGNFYNAKLVSEGYAQVATFPPNVKWVDLFVTLQTDARAAKRGLWADEAPGASSGTVGNPVPSGDTGKVVIESVDLAGEIVVIKNNDTKDINMTGWKLVSVEGDQTFNFPEGFVLKAGQTVQILSGSKASEGPGKLVWTKANVWNNDWDKAELYDSTGKLVSSK